MTAVHIDIIHGNHFIRAQEPRPIAASQLLSPAGVASAADAEVVRLAGHLPRPVYIAATTGGDLLFDAQTGQRLPPPSSEQIQQLAKHWFTGSEKLVRLSPIDEIPGEICGRKPPLDVTREARTGQQHLHRISGEARHARRNGHSDQGE